MVPEIDLQATLTIVILIGALLLLASQKVRVDLVALLVMVALIASNILAPEEVFRALGRPIIVIVAGVFVIGAALQETGVVSLIGNGLMRWGSKGRAFMLVLLMLASALMSAVLSSLLVVVIFMPIVLRISRELEVPPTQFLMPLATAALLGDQLTLIATPNNLIVNDILVQNGHEPLGFFSLTPYALVSLLLAAGWYWLMARRTLSHKALDESQEPSIRDLEQTYGLTEGFRREQVQPQSELVGSSLADGPLGSQNDINVVAVSSAEGKELEPAHPDRVLEAGDELVINGSEEAESANSDTLAPKRVMSLTDVAQAEPPSLRLCEVVVPYHSQVVGKYLAEFNLYQKFGLTVLGVNRQGEITRNNLSDVQLHTGDILLAQGTAEQIQNLRHNPALVLVTEVEPTIGVTVSTEAKITLAVLGLVLLVVMLNWVSLAVALLVASVVLVLTKSISLERAYASIDVKLIILLAGMLPLATALQQTGVTEVLATRISQVSVSIGAMGTLLLLYLCCTLVTQVTPNLVTAAVFTPIATQLAVAQERSPQMFVIAVAFAAGASYLMPLISAANLVVKSKGNYGLGDFLRNTVPIYVLQVAAIFAMFVFMG